MADHLRKQIRDAAVTLLEGLTTTGANVYPTRFYPQEIENLPCLLVYSLEEESEILTMGAAGSLGRVLALVVEAVVRATASLDDTLDEICKQAEIALQADPLFGGLAKDSFLQSTNIELDKAGDKPVGVAKMTFNIYYVAAKNAPDVSK